MNRRGSVILHVLVMGVVIAVIAAGVLRMTLMNYVATERAATAQQKRKEVDGVLNRALSSWNETGVCSAIPGLFACTGAAGVCDCYCPNDTALPHIWAHADVDGNCVLDVVSSDPQ